MASSDKRKPLDKLAGLSSYERRKYRALERGYATPYQERKAKLAALGFQSPRVYTNYRKAVSSGSAVSIPAFTKAAMLAQFGITPIQFEAMRKANREHAPEVREDARVRFQQKARRIQDYNLAIDADTSNWSRARVGYIKAFYDAVVNVETNFYSIRPSERWTLESVGDRKFQRWLETQAAYLIGYMEYSVDDFDERYGGNSPVTAALSDIA